MMLCFCYQTTAKTIAYYTCIWRKSDVAAFVNRIPPRPIMKLPLPSNVVQIMQTDILTQRRARREFLVPRLIMPGTTPVPLPIGIED